MLITLKTDIRPPTAPVLGTPSALSTTSISVPLLTAATDPSAVASYSLEYATSLNGTYVVATAAAVFPQVVTGLTPSTQYFFRARAVDSYGNLGPYSGIVSATTQDAAPITGLSWPAHVPGYVSLLPETGGYGMNTVAGSGRHLATPATTIILINSLASGNTGSAATGLGPNVFQGTFEYAWRHSASPKVIIPIVSGWVTIQDSVPCQTGTPPRPGYVTYYGQFAPNPGLFLRGANVASNGASNMAVWHLRSYMGDDVAGLGAGARDCFSSGYAAGVTQQVVLINCEFAWSVDEIVDFNRSHNQVTFIGCAFIEPLHISTIVHPEDGPGVDHGFGPIVGGDTGQIQTTAVSSLRNLWAHTTGRNPLISARTFVHANNLHYNHGRPTVGTGNGVQIIGAGATESNYANILANGFVRGPNNNTTLAAVTVASSMPAGSAGYSFANVQFGWTNPSSQNGFITSSPSGYLASTVQSDAYPGSWGTGLNGVLQWASNPLAPTLTEWHDFVTLMERTVGAQPRWRTATYGRVDRVFDQIRDRLNGVAQSDQFVDTVTEAGGWFAVPSVTINPLNPGSHWHAPLPTGSDRDTPYASGVFSDGKSRVGYTRLEEWAYEQHLYVTLFDTLAPSVPTNVQASALSQTAIRIAWSASTDTGGSGLGGYRVYRSTTSGGTYTQVGSDLSSSTLSFDDTSLSANTTRFYRVLAFDAAGNGSAQSSTVSATTQSATTGTYYGGPDLGYLTPTIYAATTAQGTGSGNSEANAMSLSTALATATAGAIVGVLPGVYSKAAAGDKFRPAWQLTNNGTASNPIIVVAKYSAIDLASKTAGARWTTADLNTVFASANRSELRHTGVTGSNGGPAFGSSFLPAVQHFQYWIGFCADEAQAQPMQDSGPAVLWAANSCKIMRSVLRGRDRSSTWGGDNHCGVRVEDWSGTAEVSDCVIAGFRTAGGSSAGHNHAGILRYSHGNQSGMSLLYNYIFDCYDGIFAKDESFATGNAQSEIYRYNILDENVVGIEMATQNQNGASTQSYCEYNLITGSTIARVGMDGQQGNGCNVHMRYNTVYVAGGGAGTGSPADMDFFGPGCELTGNILVNTSGSMLYDANGRGTAIVPANYNCYFATGGGFSARYAGSSYSSLASWRSGTNQDQQSINTNPLLVNPAAYNFELQAGSPCLTAASDGGRIGHTRGGVTPGPRYA